VVDAVAGAVAHFQRAMMMDVDQAAKAMRDEEMLAEIEDFIEGCSRHWGGEELCPSSQISPFANLLPLPPVIFLAHCVDLLAIKLR
jgi:hypothetical protein